MNRNVFFALECIVFAECNDRCSNARMAFVVGGVVVVAVAFQLIGIIDMTFAA